ncbi:MAG: PIG-L family deacetylase [Herpetosiphonaceae bacterium]|nr:PIG-L family deacetylase [Herpetosiphonaceae bacterium]
MNTVTTAPHQTALEQFGIESHWLNPVPTRHTLLVVYAHPDDESFGNAGTITRYTTTGTAVHYACATRGECGTVDPKFLDGYADVGQLRTAEQMCAAEALGLSGVHFLGYRDSGMTGSSDNEDPNAFVQAPFGQAVGQVVAAIRALQPQVVVTFGPYGGYGHPDHIMAHKVTQAAFHLAGDATAYAEQAEAGLVPWQPTKLYYPTFTNRFLKIALAFMRLRGQDPRKVGQNADIDLVEALAQITPITTAIYSGPMLARKEQAVACHASQLGGGPAFLRRIPRIVRQLNSTEYFTRIEPPWEPQRTLERDLFGRIDP